VNLEQFLCVRKLIADERCNQVREGMLLADQARREGDSTARRRSECARKRVAFLDATDKAIQRAYTKAQQPGAGQGEGNG
jgi:hypothetical protein